MGRIFITGDTHATVDISKLGTSYFPTQKELTKDDYVIVCGDFGLVWDDSKEDEYWREWLEKKNFTTLFIDGNHENHDLLAKYPVEEWNGGKVSFIKDSIIHLKRGQVFDIEGKTFFTMGGGTSIDKHLRKEGVSWWKDEIPSKEQFDEALDTLDKHNWKVDYVLTHTISTKIMEEMVSIKEASILNSFFNLLMSEMSYKEWYFGHFHKDKWFGQHRAIFHDIIELD